MNKTETTMELKCMACGATVKFYTSRYSDRIMRCPECKVLTTFTPAGEKGAK